MSERISEMQDYLYSVIGFIAIAVQLIINYIQMPVMDGYEATKAIRALPGGDAVPIIALSANAFEEDIQKSLSIGMNAHVSKPIDLNMLLDTMRGLAR